MYNKCCIVTCTSRRKDVSFHMFPKSEIGLKKWLQCINCDKLRSLSFQKLHKQFVCRNHFEKRFLSTTLDRVRLCPDAYPTLFTAREIASGIPQTDAFRSDNSKSVNTDHDYLRKRRHVDHTYCKPEVMDKHSKTDNIVDNEMDADVISSLQPLPSTSGYVQEPIADPDNENNTLSNLAAYWKSATGEEQHDDQPGSNHPALSDADDDAGSSDDDNIQEPPPPPQLNLHTSQMCRVCLALDVKMFDLRDTELKTMFQMTTGITFEEMEGSKLGSLICWECAGRLQAASTFIRKALFSESLLKGLIKKGEQIPKQYFEKVKEEADSLIPPKTLTVTETVHIVEIEDQNIVTRLNKLGQLVQSRNDENDETEEIITYEIKEQIIDENSEMDVEGDKDVAINKTGIKDALDRSSIEGTVNFSRPLLDIGHTSLRSDLTSSKEDCDDLISKTVIKKYKNPKKLPKQNIELQNPIKRSKEALSHDREYYLKGDSEDGNKKKKIKKI